MTKRKGDYRYIDPKGDDLRKRSNFSVLKLTLLKALHNMDQNDVKATAYDSKLQERYYDVVTIARAVYGDTVFTDGKLNESTRTGLNHSLKAMMRDGFVSYTGNSHINLKTMRDLVKNHWRITGEGKRVLAADYSGYLKAWMAKNRYVGDNGSFSVSVVKKQLWTDYFGA